MLHEEITKLQVALLLNFKQAMLTWKRVAKEKNPNNPRDPRFKKLHIRGRLSQVAKTTNPTALALTVKASPTPASTSPPPKRSLRRWPAPFKSDGNFNRGLRGFFRFF